MSRITVTQEVRFRNGGQIQKELQGGPRKTLGSGHVPRVARLMALAIRFDGLIRDGVVTDYAEIARFRRKLYLEFFGWKCLYQPAEVVRHAERLFRRRFQTKMEMVAYRVLSEAMGSSVFRGQVPPAGPAPS